jgi:DNA-binding CsgD family transcriptional regulator
MRQWLPTSHSEPGTQGRMASAHGAVASIVPRLGGAGFAAGLLQDLSQVLPAASWSVYRTGRHCKPTLFMSAALGVPDTTQDCWWAYLSGPYREDRTWGPALDTTHVQPRTRLCHVTAQEVEGEHRARVYEAHGMVERVSVVEHEADGSVFAVNFYRHQHQRAFRDGQIAAFEAVATVLLALTRKHIDLAQPQRQAPEIGMPPTGQYQHSLPLLRERLQRLQADLTERELDVCARVLQGMTHEGIAADLGLSLPTVKTYRNRAFARMGIHFRNELFARVLGA